MQRVGPGERDRGAVSVIAALLGVALIGFAAVGIDVAATAAQGQEVQNGADAAALAIAEDCAWGSCGSPTTTAQAYANANHDDSAVAVTVDLDSDDGEVEVETAAVRQHWFGPIVGIPQTTVTRRATVEWGYPGAGRTLPLTFSECEFYGQTGGPVDPDAVGPEQIVYLSKTSTAGDCDKPQSGNYVPGGFGYINDDAGPCTAETGIGDNVLTTPGNAVPSTCTPEFFEDLVDTGTPVLIPIFDNYGGTGNNAWYHLTGYASFRLTGYRLGGQYNYQQQGCSGNERCIKGYFLDYVDVASAFDLDPNAPAFGVLTIRFTS
jgi:hypothetical protein